MKDVLIEIIGSQDFNNEDSNIELTTIGKMEMNNGLWKLIYNETDDKKVKTVTTLANDINGAISLDKFGETNSNMTIQKGRRHTSLYSVGPYDFTLSTFGEVVDCNMTERGGNINMRYTIDINSQYASTNVIKVKVREI